MNGEVPQQSQPSQPSQPPVPTRPTNYPLPCAFYDLLRHGHWVDEARIQAVAEVANARGDVVKLHLLDIAWVS